jgi:erythromycin esterase-like protein
MAKPKEKKKPRLPKPEELKSARPLAQRVATCKTRVGKARAAATKEGKFSKYDPKYRQALKALKRAQRRLHKELLRHVVKAEPKPEPSSH